MKHKSGEHLTFEAVLADLTDLLRKWVAVIRTTVADVGRFESQRPTRSKHDKIVSRWQMYLGTMIVKAAEGIADLAPSRNVRAMTVLMRAVYEYQTKAEYFLTHGEKAEQQFLTITARKYAVLSKMARITPNSGPLLAAEYLEWKRTAGSLDEKSGNVSFTDMSLANAAAEKVKTDAKGTRYTEEFMTMYPTSSWYAHGEPTLFDEVFRNLKDESDWKLTEDYTSFDALSVLGAVNASLQKFLIAVCRAYDFGPDRLRAYNEQVERTLSLIAELHSR